MSLHGHEGPRFLKVKVVKMVDESFSLEESMVAEEQESLSRQAQGKSKLTDDLLAQVADVLAEVRKKEDPPPSFPTDKLHELVQLTLAKRRLSAVIDEVKGKIESLEEYLSEQFLLSGCNKVTVSGYSCKPSKRLYASSAVESGQLTAALMEVGMMEFVTYSPQRLSSWVAEETERQASECVTKGVVFTGVKLPQKLEGLVRIYEKVSIGVRKA